MKIFQKSHLPLLAVTMLVLLLAGCAQAPASNDTSLPQSLDASHQDVSSTVKTVETSETSEAEEALVFPESFMLETENRFDFQPGLECSAFSSAYVLRHYGEEADGLKLFETYPLVFPNNGVPPWGIEQFFTERGYSIDYKTEGTIEALKAEVSKGAPVIVFIHVEEPYTNSHATHYIPLVGYDKENLYFSESLEYLANCKDEKDVAYNRKTDIEKFERLWVNIDDIWQKPYFVISKKAAE